MDFARLFAPDRLDALPEIGAGRSGRVLRAGAHAVKVPHPFERFRRQVAREAATLALLQAQADLPVPRLRFRDRTLGFVREFLEGPSLLDLLRVGPLAAPVVAAAAAVFAATERYRAQTGTTLDFTPPNLVWCAPSGRLTLLDLGPRLEPSPFVGLAPESLREALAAYARAHPEPPLEPLHFPPSARFSVGVPVARDPGARVAWRNEACLRELGLRLDDAALTEAFGWTTEAGAPGAPGPTATSWRWASRYQDARGFGPDDAQGDGRVIYGGRVAVGPRAGAEITLKGVGPTPLVWRGQKYHEDGRVSFQRTLWEAAVCEGLCKLGFDAPRVAAVLTTGAHTVDNSEVRRPAGIAVRVARTHFRLGHLYRFRGDPGAFEAILRAGGRAALRPDFSPRNQRHLGQLVLRFAHALGRDAGRTECLCIVAFNPTVGNVRLDGHPIDFSTVRFLDRTQPDWRFMEASWTSKHHRWVFGQQVRRLVDVLAEGLGWPEARRAELVVRGHRRFAAGFNEGYLDELYALLGARPARPYGDRALDLLAAARAARAARDPAGGTQRYEFWDQTVTGPAFCLESQLPDFVAATPDRRAGALAAPGVRPSSAQRDLADKLGAALDALYGSSVARLRPLCLQDRRPAAFEAEALARVVYVKSEPDDLDAWRATLASW